MDLRWGENAQYLFILWTDINMSVLSKEMNVISPIFRNHSTRYSVCYLSLIAFLIPIRFTHRAAVNLQIRYNLSHLIFLNVSHHKPFAERPRYVFTPAHSAAERLIIILLSWNESYFYRFSAKRPDGLAGVPHKLVYTRRRTISFISMSGNRRNSIIKSMAQLRYCDFSWYTTRTWYLWMAAEPWFVCWEPARKCR